LTHHFLIAMPNMADPYFAKSLTYICEHNDQGALGIVVNRPIDMTLQALFERLSLKLGDRSRADAPIYFGGPVQTDRGFVLHLPAGDWQATLKVNTGVPDGHDDIIGLTTSKDILEAVGRGEGPSKLMVSLGYAGWSAGQLEHEITQNAWLTVEAKDAIIFDLPAEERLAAALELLGLDYARLADHAGHA
jgi:putative transcriptional regulator